MPEIARLAKARGAAIMLDAVASFGTALPAGVAAVDLIRYASLADADLSAGVGPGAEGLLRLNHTGQRAQREPVLANIVALAEALEALGIETDLDAAKAAIGKRYDAD